jgi:Spy/CpxP family protein refolding chaperone
VATIVVLAAFVCGIVLGIVGDRVWMFRHGPGAGPFHGHRMTDRIAGRLDRELKLTPQQHDEVVRILETHRARIEAIMDGVHPQVRKEIDATNAEIERILTPEQRTKFDSLKMKMRPRSQRH